MDDMDDPTHPVDTGQQKSTCFERFFNCVHVVHPVDLLDLRRN